MKIIPLTKGFVCLVDDCDFELVSKHSWSLMDSSRSFYAVTSIGNKTVFMHRFILNSPKGICVDHVNGTHVENVLDNTRQNLRHASLFVNNRNRNFSNVHSSSGGLVGVYLDKRNGRWMTRTMINGKTIRRGPFADKHDAFSFLENWKAEIGYRDSEVPTLKGGQS